jgi:hypothetical protein
MPIKYVADGNVPGAQNTVRSSATLIVAASDSLHRERADYVCDGVDDQVEIQAAIDALPSGGGLVFLLDGMFTLDAPNSFYYSGSQYALKISSDHIELLGSRGTILKLKDGIDINGGGANGFAATLNLTGNNISIRNIHFDNNYANILANFNIAIWHGTDAAAGKGVEISHNFFENNSKWATYGDGGGSFWNVHHNTIGTMGIGFHNGPSYSEIAHNVIGYGSNCETAVFLDGLRDVIVSENIIVRPSVQGIYLYDAVNYCTIANNHIFGRTGPMAVCGVNIATKGVESSVCEYNDIHNNVMTSEVNSMHYGVRLADAYVRNTIIKDNTFSGFLYNTILDIGTGTIYHKSFSDLFMDVVVASINAVHAAITGTGAEQEITTVITNPDVPRNVSITNSANSTGDVIITGVDTKGNSVTDTITIVTGGIAYGVVAFATVSKIAIPSTVANPDTIEVGISDTLGLSHVLYASGDVYKVKVNNADDPTIGPVNTTYGTVDCATINAADDITIWYKSNLNIIS